MGVSSVFPFDGKANFDSFFGRAICMKMIFFGKRIKIYSKINKSAISIDSKY